MAADNPPALGPSSRLWLAAALVPPVLAVAMILVKAQPVPFWDEWIEPMDIALETAEGSLEAADLIQQYNDSRPVFTNLLTVASTRLLGWELEAEMLFNQSLALATLVLIGSILYRHIGVRAAPHVALISVLVFSLTQRRSLLWAIQSQYYFMVLFLVAALLVLDRGRSRLSALVAAAVLCTCATFSFANGCLAWFCALPLVWRPGPRRALRLGLWGAAASVCLALFFHDYTFRAATFHSSLDPIAQLEFTLAFLGNALVGHSGPASSAPVGWIAALGAVGVAAVVVNGWSIVRRDREQARWTVWIGLAVFVAASAALAAFGRSTDSGNATGLANRYVTLSLHFWVAVVALIAENHQSVPRAARPLSLTGTARALNRAVVTLVLVLVCFSSVRSAGIPNRVTDGHRRCLEEVPVTRELGCLEGLHPAFEPDQLTPNARAIALDKIDRMSRQGLGVFRHPGP